jgi:hypothetical protein
LASAYKRERGICRYAHSGYQTIDGGNTWTKVNIGRAANKIRIYYFDNTYSLYAIGVNVYHTTIDKNDMALKS